MDAFVQNYDLMVGADYKIIANFIDSAIKKYKKDSELVCDLGCGTATVALELSSRGYDMIAVDSDFNMLIKAKEKAQSLNDDTVLFLNQDITEFELYGTVDVIYSTLDTVNYILDKKSLSNLFALVKNYLNFDGLFIFDINSQYKFQNILDNNTFVYDMEDLYCVWNTQKYKKDVYNHNLTYFINENGNFKRFENTQTQRYYSKEYIESMIKKHDFEILKCVDNYSNKKVFDKTERITYVLKTNKWFFKKLLTLTRL